MSFFSLNQLPLYTDDFFWRDLNNSNNDALVVFNPADALILSPVYLRSKKSLEEHINFIQENNVKKAICVAEDIEFLKSCQGLEYLMVFPAITANDFDYSPIYDLPNLRWLQCETMYGADESKVSFIDYSRFEKLNRLGIDGSKGHLNVQNADSVVSLAFYSGFPEAKSLTGYIPGKSLERLRILQAPIYSLDGIDTASRLRRLELQYNRRLSDISALGQLSETLIYLEINTCGKITDFSVLRKLRNLEFLILKGNNSIPDLRFINDMPKLKLLHLTMNVENGDLSLCEKLPYVQIQNRRHYSHKDIELPKNRYTNPDEIIPFEIL